MSPQDVGLLMTLGAFLFGLDAIVVTICIAVLHDAEARR